MNSSTRIFILSLLALLFVCAAVFELYFIRKAHEEAFAIASEAESLSGNSGTAQHIRSIQNDSAEDVATLMDAALSKSELAGFIGLIEQAGKDLGLAVSISSVKDEAGTSSTTPTVRIVADATGPWAPNLAFIRLLGRLPHKVSIESASLNNTNQVWRSGVTLRVSVSPEKI